MRWFMGSQWSHCGLVVGQFEGKTLVIETSDFEVVYGELEKYLDGRKIQFFTVSKDQNKIDQAIKKAKSLVGTRYSWERLPSWAIKLKLLKCFPIFPKSNVICTDVPLVAWEDVLKINPKTVHTEMLYQTLKYSNFFMFMN